MSDAIFALVALSVIFIALMLTACTEEISYAGLSETPYDHPNLTEQTDNKINLYIDFNVDMEDYINDSNSCI